jgi:hypothetical protein
LTTKEIQQLDYGLQKLAEVPPGWLRQHSHRILDPLTWFFTCGFRL